MLSMPSSSSMSKPYFRHAMLRKLIVPSSKRLHGRPCVETGEKSYVEEAEMVLVARHGAAAPVELVQNAQVLVAEKKGAQARGEAEDLVEGHGDEVGFHLRQVEAVRGNERGSVEKNQPLVSLRGRGVIMHTSWK